MTCPGQGLKKNGSQQYSSSRGPPRPFKALLKGLSPTKLSVVVFPTGQSPSRTVAALYGDLVPG